MARKIGGMMNNVMENDKKEFMVYSSGDDLRILVLWDGTFIASEVGNAPGNDDFFLTDPQRIIPNIQGGLDFTQYLVLSKTGKCVISKADVRFGYRMDDVNEAIYRKFAQGQRDRRANPPPPTMPAPAVKH